MTRQERTSVRAAAWSRSLSRLFPNEQPRTLGAKFVGTGVLAGAIELLRATQLEVHGVAAGDLAEMTARARAALEAARDQAGGERER
jgi:hypothetical protein